jgi:acyl-CoA thioesterase I
MPFQHTDAPDICKIRSILENKTPANWVFTGDSITAGVEHTHGYRSYPEIFAEWIRHGIGRSLDHIINSGISGHTSQDIIFYFDWRIKQFNPSVVSLMIGTNDCTPDRNVSLNLFKENLHFLVNAIRALDAIPVLHTPNAIIADEAPERFTLPEYVEVIRDVAETDNVILIDHWSYWQDNEQTNSLTGFKQWLDDALHPNGAGHVQIAWLIFKKLSVFNDDACG